MYEYSNVRYTQSLTSCAERKKERATVSNPPRAGQTRRIGIQTRAAFYDATGTVVNALFCEQEKKTRHY